MQLLTRFHSNDLLSLSNIFQIYNYSSVKHRNNSRHVCCGMNRIFAGQSCCNGRGFNSSLQVCADMGGCGNGTVCYKTSQNTARCDRCDFSHDSYCAYTKGYYTPEPTPPALVHCGTFTQLVSKNATLRGYNDENLEPFSVYEYYVVVYNTEGNVSSRTSKNKTLTDIPEGLSPPDVVVRSARSIEIVFRAPTKPNGIISEYKLTRIDLNATGTTLVYRGLKLSFLDTQVLPITGYFYILEVCSSLCSNITSRRIYTQESTPENVYPPTLKALSAYRIEISWQPPGRPNGMITGYKISRVNNTGYIVRQWKRNNLVLVDNSSDIRPYTNYSYAIAACTIVGCSSGPWGFVTTLEAPPARVYAPVLLIRSARMIEVNWREPAVPNGVIIMYAIYRGNILICNTTGDCQFEAPSPTRYRYQDDSVRPHSLYSYVIEASTVAGGTNSSETHARTPQSTPEQIYAPTLTPQSYASILVTWGLPDNPNGVIKNYSVIQDTDIEHPAGLSFRLSVTGLEPFTEYNFQIKACTPIGCGVGNRSAARTLEAAPTGQLAPNLLSLSDSVVKVTWRRPQVPNGIILQYQVQRISSTTSVPDLVFSTTRPFHWQTLNSGLLPYRSYKYRIRVRNSAGWSESPWATVRTKEGAPAGISPPIVYVLNATSVRASWTEPREPNGVITLYELWSQNVDTASDRGLNASSTKPEQNVTVAGLMPSTNYEFRLEVRTVGGIGYSSWTLAETLEAQPLGLSPLTWKHVNGRELRLSWNEPAQPNGRITSYVVRRDGDTVYSGISRKFNLRQLQPFTSYTFQLEACTTAGCSRGSMQIITTSEIPPDLMQAPVFRAVNSTYVILEWQPPALPNGIIILYQVFRTDRMFAIYNTSDPNVTSYGDMHLQPYTQYRYKVRTLNSAGATESLVVSVTTRQAAPEFILPPVIGAVTSTDIEITWSLPGKPNGVVTSYTLRRNDSVINHWGYTVLQYTDTSISAYTLYGYWLTVCTRGGCADSAKSIVKSGEGRPRAVRAPVLTVLTSYALRVKWQPPVIPNGVVTRYVLYQGKNPIYNGTDMFYVVSNLLPYTRYSFHVLVCTKSECTAGPSSETKTFEAPPKHLDMPTYTIFGPRLLEINWALPRQPNGVVLYYTLRRNGTLIYNGSDLSYKDMHVEPFTHYSYQVSAFNSAGYVSGPVLYTDRTSPSTPENVTKPQLVPLSGTEIRATWSSPAIPNGIINAYLVLYDNIQVNVGTNLSYIARNLNYFTTYNFRIRACTNYPSSCADSDVSSSKTLEGIPRGLLAPFIPEDSLMARSVVVSWREPSNPNGVILTYSLNRSQDGGESSVLVFTGLSFTYNDTKVLPFETYKYRVSAENMAGLGTSVWTTVTTGSAPPEGVGSPRILAVTQTTIVVVFVPPERSNGRVVNYIVQANNHPVSEGFDLERTISNLKPYTEYSLRVLACTIAGCTASQAISSRTGIGKPGRVEKPSFGEVTTNSIEVNWNPPIKPNGEIIRYEMSFPLVMFLLCTDWCRLVVSSNRTDSKIK